MNDVIEIDGVKYKIPQWLEVGTSFFMPILDTKKAVKVVYEFYEDAKFPMTYCDWVEQGVWGVRFWRTM